MIPFHHFGLDKAEWITEGDCSLKGFLSVVVESKMSRKVGNSGRAG